MEMQKYVYLKVAQLDIRVVYRSVRISSASINMWSMLGSPWIPRSQNVSSTPEIIECSQLLFDGLNHLVFVNFLQIFILAFPFDQNLSSWLGHISAENSREVVICFAGDVNTIGWNQSGYSYINYCRSTNVFEVWCFTTSAQKFSCEKFLYRTLHKLSTDFCETRHFCTYVFRLTPFETRYSRCRRTSSNGA